MPLFSVKKENSDSTMIMGPTSGLADSRRRFLRLGAIGGKSGALQE
jgi:hypothetical protein